MWPEGILKGKFSCLKVFFDKLFVGLMFNGVQWVSLGLLEYEQALEFNGVIVRSGGW